MDYLTRANVRQSSLPQSTMFYMNQQPLGPNNCFMIVLNQQKQDQKINIKIPTERNLFHIEMQKRQ